MTVLPNASSAVNCLARFPNGWRRSGQAMPGSLMPIRPSIGSEVRTVLKFASMREEIVEKLRWGLEEARKGINEPLVIFILVKARKLLEYKRFRGRFGALRFYCDWTLHRRLDRAGAAFLLGVVENIIRSWKDDEQAAEKAANILHFAEFWKELRALLAGEGLPTDVIDDLALRLEFFRHYASAIHDTSLEYSAQEQQVRKLPKAKKSKVKTHIRRLTLKPMATDLTNQPSPLPLWFHIETDDPKKSYDWQSVLKLDYGS